MVFEVLGKNLIRKLRGCIYQNVALALSEDELNIYFVFEEK